MGFGGNWEVSQDYLRVGVRQTVWRKYNIIWSEDVLEYKGCLQYDVTYCVRASWYIPDFYKVVRKMVSMTKQGGYIIFDVMDKMNSDGRDGIMLGVNDEIPDVDCIIVTPILYYDEICNMLQKKTKIPVISIEELFENNI